MSRAAWIIVLAATAPVIGFAAGTGLFQFWLGLDAARQRFPDATFGWSDVALGAALTVAWGLLLFAGSVRLHKVERLALAAGAVIFAALTFWVGVDQLVVL